MFLTAIIKWLSIICTDNHALSSDIPLSPLLLSQTRVLDNPCLTHGLKNFVFNFLVLVEMPSVWLLWKLMLLGHLTSMPFLLGLPLFDLYDHHLNILNTHYLL